MTQRVKPTRRRGYTRLSAKRQITLPMAVVQKVGLLPGDELRVNTDGESIVLTRELSLRDQRLKAIKDSAGILTGVYEPGYLERLRNEWR